MTLYGYKIDQPVQVTPFKHINPDRKTSFLGRILSRRIKTYTHFDPELGEYVTRREVRYRVEIPKFGRTLYGIFDGELEPVKVKS